MPDTNETLSHRWFEEVWNKGRVEAIDELFAQDGVAHGLGEDGDLHGPEAFKAFHTVFYGAFPDIHITIEDVITSGDKSAIRFSGTATHLGDQLGIPATHRKVTFTGMTFVRWKNGQIAEGWNNVDVPGILKQIGAS